MFPPSPNVPQYKLKGEQRVEAEILAKKGRQEFGKKNNDSGIWEGKKRKGQSRA